VIYNWVGASTLVQFGCTRRSWREDLCCLYLRQLQNKFPKARRGVSVVEWGGTVDKGVAGESSHIDRSFACLDDKQRRVSKHLKTAGI